jgi:hypothetical protein
MFVQVLFFAIGLWGKKRGVSDSLYELVMICLLLSSFIPSPLAAPRVSRDVYTHK